MPPKRKATGAATDQSTKTPARTPSTSKATKSATAKASRQTRSKAPVAANTSDKGNDAATNTRSDHEESPTPPAGPEPVFDSHFPGLELHSVTSQHDKFTVAQLKELLTKANNPRRSRLQEPIRAKIREILGDLEKTILMLGLIGGCREGLIRKAL